MTVLSPAPREEWATILGSEADGTLEQGPQWFDAILRATGARDLSRLYRFDNGRRVVLPLLGRQPLPGLRLDANYLPSFGRADVLATDGLTTSDVQFLLSDLQRSRSVGIRLRSNHLTPQAWEAGLPKGWHGFPRRVEVLDLSGGFPVVYEERFHRSVRKAVRKAERSGVTVRRETSQEQIAAFYELYERWTDNRARERGLPQALSRVKARRREPLAKFEAAAAMLGDSCRVWVASYQDQPIAGLITLVHGRHATAWRGYGHKEFAGPLRATVLLHRLAIEDACLAGCQDYHFGESGGSATLERFKQTFGARPQPGFEARFERLPFTSLERGRSALESKVARGLARLSRGTKAPAVTPADEQ